MSASERKSVIGMLQVEREKEEKEQYKVQLRRALSLIGRMRDEEQDRELSQVLLDHSLTIVGSITLTYPSSSSTLMAL